MTMASSVATTRLRFVRALRSRPFAWLWAGQTISALGDGAYTVALAWAVLKLTGSATDMGIVLVARSVPMLIFLLLGGVAADRLPRRLVMLASDAGRAVAVLAIALLEWQRTLQLWHLVALAAFFGFVSSFFMPAYQSIAPELVEVEALPSANGLSGLSRQIGMLLGPLIGGALVAALGAQDAFAFDGLTFVVSALCLLAVRMPAAVQSARPEAQAAAGTHHRGIRGVTSDLREGMSYILASSWLWVTILIASILNLAFSGAVVVALPKLVADVYHAGATLFGVIATLGGLGAIFATFVVGQARRLRHRGILAYGGSAVASAGLIAFGLPLPLAALPLVALGASFMEGFGISVFSVIWDTVLQELVPADKLGRVSSVDLLGSFCLQPVGFLLAGVLADRIGPAWVFVGAGSVSLALNLAGLCIRGIRQLE
jgi:MFS family permease